MKKLLFIGLLSAFVLSGAPAFADQNGPPPKEQGGGDNGGGQPGGSFEEHKAKILERMSEMISRMQTAQKCVQAAKSADELPACMPQRPDRGGDHDGPPPGDK